MDETEQWVCGNCKKNISKTDKFCKNCGEIIERYHDVEEERAKRNNKKYALFIIGLAIAILVIVIMIVNSYNEQQQKLQEQIRQQQEQQELLRQQQETLRQQELERQRQEQLAQEQERQRLEQEQAIQTVLNSLQPTRSDYSWRLDLINEQQGRLDNLYITKAGVKMQQEEYSGWIEALRSATNEYSTRATNALSIGESYRNQLNTYQSSLGTNYYNSEISWINKNRDIITSDLNGNLASFNSNIESYNNCFVYKTGCN